MCKSSSCSTIICLLCTAFESEHVKLNPSDVLIRFCQIYLRFKYEIIMTVAHIKYSTIFTYMIGSR